MQITEQTRIIELTVGQLIDLLNNVVKPIKPEPIIANYCDDEFIHGYAGLARFLKCNPKTIWEHKKTGKYDKAIIRNGKKLIFKKSEIIKALEIIK